MPPHADQYLTYTQESKVIKQKLMEKSPNRMLVFASKIMHSVTEYFCWGKGNWTLNINASQSTEISASSKNTVLLCCEVHIYKHLKAVYELFNYTLNVILLSARSKAQQYPTCCAYTGAPWVISILLPAEKCLPNAIMITALLQLPSHYLVCRPSWLHKLNSRLSVMVCSEQRRGVTLWALPQRTGLE